MQAVIFAAGKSTRTYPLTVNKPKPLLKVANKMILVHNLEQLQGLVDEVFIVVGFEKEQITEAIGDSFDDIKVNYIEQKEQLGTGHALSLCKDKLGTKFLVMNGDDLYHHDDIEECLKHQCAVLAQEVEDPSRFGVIVVVDNVVKDIVEKPSEPVSNLANTGLCVLNETIFSVKLKKSERGEFEVIDYLKTMMLTGALQCVIVKQYWFPMGYPWDLLKANNALLENIESDIKGEVEENVTVKGTIIVGEGTKILNGVYIEGNVVIGKNCKIGPNAYLRGNTSIGDNCHIGQAVEIKNSIIMDHSNVPHLSYVGDSVIGSNVNLGAGTNVANLRHDNANVQSKVKDELVDTGLRKFGIVVGDGVHTGINTTIYPGRKLWPGTTTLPGEVVKEDKK